MQAWGLKIFNARFFYTVCEGSIEVRLLALTRGNAEKEGGHLRGLSEIMLEEGGRGE